MPFELVSANILTTDTITEYDPGSRGQFGIIYQNDSRGNASANTGFFVYFKQGTLQNYGFNVQEKINNTVVDINYQGINNTDTWLYQLNTNNNSRVLWTKVDNVYANAYLQTENSKKTIIHTQKEQSKYIHIFQNTAGIECCYIVDAAAHFKVVPILPKNNDR